MKLHEYQAKALLRRYAVQVPAGIVARNPSEARNAARQLGGPVMVKAQIQAGGRGKAGAIRLAASEAEAGAAAAAILAAPLRTTQTGGRGLMARCVLVEQRLESARELYLGLSLDYAAGMPLIMASQAGGVDIETAASASPESLVMVRVDPLLGLQPFHCRQLAFGLGLAAELHQAFGELAHGLYQLLLENDCELVEINPLALSAAGSFIALDAKIELEDNGLRRHPELMAWRDEGDDEPLEVEARRAGLNYLKLDGDIGILANGAGLAMATMDLIHHCGGRPANFLDMGGGASGAMIEAGMRLLLSDPQVKGILINVFGGILRCDLLAESIIRAAQRQVITIPVVIRLEGSEAEEGRRLLAAANLKLSTAADLGTAAATIVARVRP